MTPSDETLLCLVHNGDDAAMATLVQRYHARLRGFVFRYTQDHQISEDIVQETFLRLIRAREREPEVFAPWLFRVALNLCRDHAKSAYRRHEQATLPDDEGAAPRPSADRLDREPADPEARAEHRELREAVEALPPPQREVLLLHYFGDWTLAQVATALRQPLGTVKSRLFAGLAQLRRAYRAADPKGGQAVAQ